MKNSLLYYLIASSLALSGCEVGQQPSNVVSERSFGTIFDVPETATIEPKPLNTQESNKTNSEPTDFTPIANTSNSNQITTPPGVALDKSDLLYGFYNSGIVGKPADFDNFFDEAESRAPTTKIASTRGVENTLSTSSLNSPFNLSDDPVNEFTGLDNFLGLDSQAPVKFDDFSSDFQLDKEKQEKIAKIKESRVSLQKNHVIADQIRIKDADEKLVLDLANLKKNIPINEKKLARLVSNELKHKIRLLDAETALKVAELKMLASTRSDKVVARVEDQVLGATSGVRKGLIRQLLSSEPENYYQLKEQGKQLDAVYQVDIAKVKLQYQKKIYVVEKDVKSLRIANKKIISNRLAELEAQRIADALIVEARVKTKNQEIVNQSYPEFKDKILKYSKAFKEKLTQKEKEESVLARLEAKYISNKLARKSARELENRQYIADINRQIEQEQASYEDQSRDRLNVSRDAKINSINTNLKRSIKRVESGGVQALADLKSKNAREHQKQKNILQAPYKKKKQALNQKYQQAKSKVLSRFRAEEYAVVAKIRKETGVANREIDTRVKAEIKVLLNSFKALKKEEVAQAKKISPEKPKKSLGFFESLF